MLNTSPAYKTAVVSGSRDTDSNIYFGIYDVTAKGDSNPVASDSQTFAPTSGIKDGIRTPLFNMGTFEDNLISLDGSFYLAPDDVSYTDLLGWWSKTISGADGTFPGGVILQNLIVDGGFIDSGDSHWSNNGMDVTVLNASPSGEKDLLAQYSYANLIQNPAIINGHMYYMSASIKANTDLAGLNLMDSDWNDQLYVYPTGSGSYETISSRKVMTKDIPASNLCIIDNRDSGWDKFYIKQAILIDLTDTFGAGLEPDKATMDAMVAAYWAGTLSSGINPSLTISFSTVHTSLGLGLFFDPTNGDTCDSFKIVWYNGSNQLAAVNVVGNTDTSYNISQPVTNYNKIIITFIKTNRPYRYVKLMEINFGLETAFDNDDIISASITEEIDPISNTISMNKLKFVVLNTDQRFNMTNPSGVYAYLQQNQQLVARSKLRLPGGSYESVALGTYFLSDWKNATGLTASLEATDAIGLLDKTTYYNSPFWVNATITAVITHILNDAGSYPFIIDSSAASEIVNGYVPVLSHREALQLVLISTRCVLRINRDGIIHVMKNDYSSVVNTVTYDTVIGTPTIEQKPLITSVIASEYSYVLNTTPVTLATSTFTLNGTNTMVIPYDSDKTPAVSVSISISGSGSIVGTPKLSATSATVTVTAAGSCTLTVTGQAYAASTRTITATMANIPAGSVPQAATVTDNTLICGDGRGLSVANNMLNYYQHRIKQTFDYWDNPAMQAGDNISVQNMFGATSNGIVEHQEITFAPNLKASVEVTG